MWEKLRRTREVPNTPFLPFDVRYALQYRQAKMGVEELLALANSPFERAATYLLIKAVADDPEKQRNLIESCLIALQHDFENENFKPNQATALGALLNEKIKALEKGTAVSGEKLALLSRNGIDTWHSLYEAHAKRCALDTERSTFLIGHSTFVGLDSYSRHFREAGRDFFILIPDHIKNTEISTCGYHVTHDMKVDFLNKNFHRDNACIVDDVIRTGDSVSEVLNFWTNGGMYSPPAVEVILDATESSL